MLRGFKKLSKLSESDEWETDPRLYSYLQNHYDFYPWFDTCATKDNTKCIRYCTQKENSLNSRWKSRNWCNPPHNRSKKDYVSMTEKFVKKACWEFLLNGNETMMIIPANSICTTYSEEFIINIAEIHPITFPIFFLHYGKMENYSRNRYVCVIWRNKK